MSYTVIGQISTAVRWADGTLDDPTSVIVACDACGCLVPYPLTEKHDAAHPLTMTAKAATK